MLNAPPCARLEREHVWLLDALSIRLALPVPWGEDENGWPSADEVIRGVVQHRQHRGEKHDCPQQRGNQTDALAAKKPVWRVATRIR
jgi:hypothetical protein